MIDVHKNRLEWAVFGVGLVLILGLLGYLAYDALTLDGRPPVVDVQLGGSESRNGTYQVPVTLRNLGDETAEAVTVEVVLIQGDSEIETAELTIDFLPRSSTRSGWVTFLTDPRSVDEIEPRVLGFQVP